MKTNLKLILALLFMAMMIVGFTVMIIEGGPGKHPVWLYIGYTIAIVAAVIQSVSVRKSQKTSVR